MSFFFKFNYFVSIYIHLVPETLKTVFSNTRYRSLAYSSVTVIRQLYINTLPRIIQHYY